jgi:hypothetical protein
MIKRFDTKQTFIVKISNCQNGTWQGKIIWADENRSRHFRSMLEMLKLMDEATRAVSEEQVIKTSNE